MFLDKYGGLWHRVYVIYVLDPQAILIISINSLLFFQWNLLIITKMENIIRLFRQEDVQETKKAEPALKESSTGGGKQHPAGVRQFT